MSWLLAALLFVVGWVLVDSGMQFLGFVVIVLGVLSLTIKPGESRGHAGASAAAGSYSGAGYAQPVIIRGGHVPKVQQVKLRIKDPWYGTTTYEDRMTGLSDTLLFPVKILWRLLRIGGGNKGGGKK